MGHTICGHGTTAAEALVLHCEPGIGKTALLGYAASRSSDMTVLSASGVEAESELAFAGLFGLLRPLIGQMTDLPPTQAAALARALGLAPASGTDRLLVSAAVLGLLAAAAEQAPVLVIVDDAQWLDTPSAQALVFAARRLNAERVALLFGAREGDVRSFAGAGIPDLRLGGLEQSAATAVLARRAHLAPGLRERLLAQAAGNPLALLELPDALSAEQLSGRAALPEPIPLTDRLQAAFAGRFRDLPQATQAMLLLIAADDTGEAATILQAAGELGLSSAALELPSAAI